MEIIPTRYQLLMNFTIPWGVYHGFMMNPTKKRMNRATELKTRETWLKKNMFDEEFISPQKSILGDGFKYLCFFTPTWGDDPN